MNKKTIQVDADVWEKLMQLKIERGARNISEVLRQLLACSATVAKSADVPVAPRSQPQRLEADEPGKEAPLPSYVQDNPWVHVLSKRTGGRNSLNP
ncbi:ribbon-helix-helix protein, CopG family [Thermofilum sp.]|uniref:ribbon-helix-helix protein, CopG family n=1 Tax=Thermofilum sp. TaxID=1961369 RepID=UPI0025826E9E|nr:ribbon-helix-helix protein, CopG family [Thermofilum sp.]